MRFRFGSKRKSEQKRSTSKASTYQRLTSAQGSVGTVETNSTFGGQDVLGGFRTPQPVESVSDGRISMTSDFPPYQQPTVSTVVAGTVLLQHSNLSLVGF